MNSELTNTNEWNFNGDGGRKGNKSAHALRHTPNAMDKILVSRLKTVRMHLTIHADRESNKFSRVFIIFMDFIIIFYPAP